MVNRYYKNMIYKLFPGRCILCNLPSGRQLDLCSACENELPWLGPHCQYCALPLAKQDAYNVCGQCLRKPPYFSHCYTALRYDFPVDHLITGFKHRRKLNYGAILSQIWLDNLGADLDSIPDALIPVPLHWRRRLLRGFNQSELLAEDFSRALNIPICRAISHPQATVSQQGLSAAARRTNLHKAFHFKPEYKIDGLHLAIVDDVVTTTATANTLAAILARNGARQVDIWCLARTP